MTSVYIVITVALVVFTLVSALTWLSYRYGRVTLLKEQVDNNYKIKEEAENEFEKVKALPIDELDNRLSKWMRSDE